MGKLLEPLNLEWVIKDETIVVKRRRTKKSGDELALSAPLQRRVTGRITDGQGTPLIGATITIKGEATTTTSDSEGAYQIEVSKTDAVLVFSSVGFMPSEKLVGEESIINMVLKVAVSDLEEVVVVGYGVQKKETATGAIASIKGSTIA